MEIDFTKKIKGLLVVTMALFISCGDSSQALMEINADLQEPLGTASNIRMVYTDSIKIQAILTAPKHVDYTNLSFRYAEFPEGLKVIFFDDLERENEVVAGQRQKLKEEADKTVDVQARETVVTEKSNAAPDAEFVAAMDAHDGACDRSQSRAAYRACTGDGIPSHCAEVLRCHARTAFVSALWFVPSELRCVHGDSSCPMSGVRCAVARPYPHACLCVAMCPCRPVKAVLSLTLYIVGSKAHS